MYTVWIDYPPIGKTYVDCLKSFLGVFCISLRLIINPPSVFSVPDSKNQCSEVSTMALAISFLKHPVNYILFLQLLQLDPNDRIGTLDEFKKQPYISDVDFEKVFKLEVKPGFVPPVSIVGVCNK
jgi:hypothetical protein